jgi:hypothetical protein
MLASPFIVTHRPRCINTPAREPAHSRAHSVSNVAAAWIALNHLTSWPQNFTNAVRDRRLAIELTRRV